jgi:hypothetical protein
MKAKAPKYVPQVDVRALLDTRASQIAQAWIRDAFRTMGTVDFYLYWAPAKTGEAMGAVVHASVAPGAEYTQDIQLSSGWDVARATRQIAGRLATLPILGTLAA